MAKADVNFMIGADGSAFAKDLNKVGGQMNDFLTRLGGKFFGLQAIAVGVQKAFAGLSAPLRAFGELENTQAQLAVMMDSKDAAESLTSSLQKLATNGVVSMQDLLAASRPLTHFMEGAEIEHWVARFADIAAASKIPAERFASMAARLNDMGRAEFTELANAGIPIFEALGTVIGASADEVRKLSTEGKVSMEDFLQAIRLLTDEGGRFHQMNATMSGTLLGSFATLSASWRELVAEIGRPIAEGLTPVLHGIIDLVQQVKPAFMEVMAIFGELFNGAGGGFSSIRELVSSVIGGLRPIATALAQGILPVVKALFSLLKPIGSVLESVFTTLKPLFFLLSQVLGAIGTVLQLLAPILQIIHAPLQLLATVVDALFQAVIRACGGMEAFERRAQMVARGVEVIVRAMEAHLSKFDKIGNAIATFITGVDMQFEMEWGETIRRAGEAAVAMEERRKKAAAERLAAERAAAREAERAAAARDKLHAVMDADWRTDTLAEAARATNVDRKVRLTLLADGFGDEEELARELKRLQGLMAPSDAEIARYKALLALENQVIELRRAAAAEEEKQRKEAARAAAEARATALKEYEARKQARREAEWEKNTSPEDKLAWYYGAGSRQLSPGATTKAQVQADMDALAEEDPVKYASMIEDMERWLEKVTALEEQQAAEAARRQDAVNSARVSVVQSSLASVGGGGAAIRIGDKQFREAQQQTKLLATISTTLEDAARNKKLLAVLA